MGKFVSGCRAAGAGLMTILVGASAQGAVISNTVATYDAASNANTVDGAATGSTGSVGTFSSLVTTAHAANLGGVVNFETASYDPAADPASDTQYTFRFGAGALYTLGMTTDISIDPVTSVNASSGSITPISGSGVLANQATGSDIRLTFTPSLGHRLTDVAFTILGRTQYPAEGQNYTVTATFSGGGTQVATANIGNVKGSTDTFFWFQAPAGQTISNILVDNVSTTVTSNPVFDDLGFIAVVPEPAAIGMLGVALVGLLHRRRRLA